jgi:hypothetical protein
MKAISSSFLGGALGMRFGSMTTGEPAAYLVYAGCVDVCKCVYVCERECLWECLCVCVCSFVAGDVGGCARGTAEGSSIQPKGTTCVATGAARPQRSAIPYRRGSEGGESARERAASAPRPAGVRARGPPVASHGTLFAPTSAQTPALRP